MKLHHNDYCSPVLSPEVKHSSSSKALFDLADHKFMINYLIIVVLVWRGGAVTSKQEMLERQALFCRNMISSSCSYHQLLVHD